MVYTILLMVTRLTLVSLQIIKCMVEADLNGLMVLATKVNLKWENSVAKENSITLMVTFMKAAGKKIREMDQENSISLTLEKHARICGKMMLK